MSRFSSEINYSLLLNTQFFAFHRIHNFFKISVNPFSVVSSPDFSAVSSTFFWSHKLHVLLQCSAIQASKRPGASFGYLEGGQNGHFHLMHPVGLAEDVICLKKHIRINYIPTTLSLQHSCPSIQDSLKYEGISI